MKPGLSWLRTNSMVGPSSASSEISSIATIRGLSPPKSVPATLRCLFAEITVTLMQGLVVGPVGRARLLDLDVAVLADRRRVDEVDRIELRPQQRRENRLGQRLHIELAGVTGIFDRDAGQTDIGDLAGEAAELFGELQIRLQPRALLRPRSTAC